MKQRNLRAYLVTIPVCFSVVLGLAACGGSDEGSKGNSAGSSATAGSSNGGSSSTGNNTSGSSNTSGGSNASGSGNTSGGSGPSTGGGFDTGLPTDKPLSSLTPTEGQALCDKVDTYFSTGAVGTGLQDFSCRVSGLLAALLSQPQTDADAQMSCKAAYDSCKAAPAETQTDQCTAPDASCTATVGELEACMNDSVGYLQQVESAFPSCDKITLAELMSMDMPEQPAEPASCTTLDMKCPDGPAVPGGMSMP